LLSLSGHFPPEPRQPFTVIGGQRQPIDVILRVISEMSHHLGTGGREATESTGNRNAGSKQPSNAASVASARHAGWNAPSAGPHCWGTRKQQNAAFDYPGEEIVGIDTPNQPNAQRAERPNGPRISCGDVAARALSNVPLT
jgi:hypothetical protein